MSTVLVVDDEPQLLRALSINLRARGYTVVTAATGAAALREAAQRPPDVVVLDLGLPDMDGTEVLHGLRGWSRVPILVLSARPDSRDKVEALDAGADDYVTKPFDMEELMARLRAMTRRHDGSTAAPLVQTTAFTVDLTDSRVERDGETVHLTPTEWRLLEALARHPGRLVTQPQLLRQVWGPGRESETHYLRLYMAQLRKKLEPEPARPRHLLTEPGMGYRLVL